MTHPAYLLARLNPKNVRHDVGSGGLPELTPQDIAGALAFVAPGLGREMVMRVWWPDGAQLTAEDLDQRIMEAQLAEWMERGRRLLDAQLLEEVADTEQQKRYAKLRMQTARLRMWPRMGEGSCYRPIRQAVLSEICADLKCPACNGRGVVLAERRVATCQACEGHGHLRVSDRARAKAVGYDQAAYRRHYARVYEWTFNLCRDAMEPALAQFKRAVG